MSAYIYDPLIPGVAKLVSEWVPFDKVWGVEVLHTANLAHNNHT